MIQIWYTNVLYFNESKFETLKIVEKWNLDLLHRVLEAKKRAREVEINNQEGWEYLTWPETLFFWGVCLLGLGAVVLIGVVWYCF